MSESPSVDRPPYLPAWAVRYVPRPGTQTTAPVLVSVDDRGPAWAVGERLHHLFERRCRAFGTRAAAAVAIESEAGSVSFAALDALGTRIARYLADRGVRAGDRIALLMDRSVFSHASVLAASRLGAAYVPLDASFPNDRIEFIAADSDVTIAVTLGRFADRLSGLGVPVLCLDTDADAIARYPATPLDVPAGGDPLAYVIYTSGSTGRPKGVPIRQSSICNFVRVAGTLYGYREQDRVYQGMTIAFDFSVEELWVPLLAGATLVPATSEGSLVGSDLHDFLAARRITAMCCVPTLLATLEPDLPGLRLLLVSGEACPPDVIAPWFDPHRRILNAYGPTEATVTATWSVMRPGRPVTIGGPLPTYAIVILDPDRPEALPPGATGEIAIAGIALSDGYLNRPEQTARAFVPDFLGLANNPSGTLYRTGDLGRITDDAEVEYLGRLDFQVKIRGYRIELDEIEVVARQAPSVGNAVVQPFVPPGSNQPELVAYLTPALAGQVIDIAEVDARLRDSLPAYMVPSYYEQLDELPLLPSTKVDRKALRPPTGQRFVSQSGPIVGARTRTEHRLLEILRPLLGLDEISVAARFIDDLGANSLTLAMYVTAIREQLGERVSVKQLYQHPTVAELAMSIDAASLAPEMAGEGRDADTRTIGLPHAAVPRLPSRAAAVATGFGQALFWLLFVLVSTTISVTALRWIEDASGVLDGYVRAVGGASAAFFTMGFVLIAVKWLAVGRFDTTPIPIYTFRFLRFWIARRAIQANPFNLFVGTPLFNAHLRLLGVRVGKGAVVYARSPICTDLVEIGERAILRERVVATGYSVRDGILYPGRVTIGADAVVCEACTIDIDTNIGAASRLGTASGLLRGQDIPPGATYQGSPAEPSTTNFTRVTALAPSSLRKARFVFSQLLTTCGWKLPLAYAVVALIARLGLTDSLSGFSGTIGRVADTATLAALLVASGLTIAIWGAVIVPRLLNRFVEPGVVHPLYGFQYSLARSIAKNSNRRLLHALLGDSALIVHYLSAIGYDMRNATQSGSNFGMEMRHHSPFLCRFNRDTMVSDGLSLVNMEIGPNSFVLRPIELPESTYLGNALSYPAGSAVGRDCLIATKAAIPIDGPIRTGVGILGSPSFEIPRSVERDELMAVYSEPAVLRQRLDIKLWSNLLTMELYLLRSWAITFATLFFSVEAFPGFSSEVDSPFATGVALTGDAVLAVLLMAPVLMLFEQGSRRFRRLRPQITSLYEPGFWAHERCWKLNYNPFLIPLAGTPLKPLMMRLQGARIGRLVYDDGAHFPEPSLVSIGDHASLNIGATIQCHSLEGGVFKSGNVDIGRYCTVGTGAFVHYGTTLEDGSVLEADSFLMKGSRLASGSRWLGNPAHDVGWPTPAPEPAEIDSPATDRVDLIPVTSPTVHGRPRPLELSDH